MNKQWSDAFNEWAKRYSENPNIFSAILDEKGVPYSDYGDNCAAYFESIINEQCTKT